MINPFVDTLSNAILIVFLAFILVVALGITVMALQERNKDQQKYNADFAKDIRRVGKK